MARLYVSFYLVADNAVLFIIDLFLSCLLGETNSFRQTPDMATNSQGLHFYVDCSILPDGSNPLPDPMLNIELSS